ncbi:hypothetical protein [Paraburkholderia sp. BR14320]|uniref:hypothetical protein n=1 Tax=unclassified Paraburkholderia TaxID=2615204 RepID=UPI0034CF6C77
MDAGTKAFDRLTDDVLCGRIRWVPRPPERELSPAPLDTAKSRRERDRLRKQRWRAGPGKKP